jgi:predicted nucleic acid-binding protein
VRGLGHRTCLLIDIADADPQFAAASATLLDAARQELFLYHLQVSWSEAWSHAETQAAHAAWHRYVQSRRLQRIAKRSMADILIGALAERFDGLLTRNESDFRSVFPTMPILLP